jgi:hypothetical protein
MPKGIHAGHEPTRNNAERIAGTVADALKAGDYRQVVKRLNANVVTRHYRIDLLQDGCNVVVEVKHKRGADEARRLVHVSKVKAI